jgi:hypothetical protein
MTVSSWPCPTIHLFLRAPHRFFPGQVVNPRPIGGAPRALPAGSAYNASQRQRCLRLAALWGRLATCGRLAIGLSRSAPRTRLKATLHLWRSPEASRKEPATRSPALPGTVKVQIP